MGCCTTASGNTQDSVITAINRGKSHLEQEIEDNQAVIFYNTMGHSIIKYDQNEYFNQ